MASNATIAKRIKERMKQRGYSVQKVAAATGIPIETLNRSFSGQASLTSVQQRKIAKFLNVTLSDLTGTN